MTGSTQCKVPYCRRLADGDIDSTPSPTSAGSRPPDDDALLGGLSDDRSAAEITDLTYLDYLDRLAPLEQMLRSNGQWFHPHPWLTTFIGDSTVEPTVADELTRMTPADLGTFGQIVLSAFRREAVASPLVRLPADELVYVLNLIRFPTTADNAEASRLVDANRAIYERVLAAGGSLYPVSAFPMSPAAWQRHFGPAWNLLRRRQAALRHPASPHARLRSLLVT